MIAWTIAGEVPKVGGISAGLDDAEPAAGAGADEDDAAALAQRLGDDLDAVRDPLVLFLDRGDDLPILVDHHVDDVADRRLVDGEADRVDGFGRQGLHLECVGMDGSVRRD